MTDRPTTAADRRAAQLACDGTDCSCHGKDIIRDICRHCVREARQPDSEALREAIGAVITRWYRLGLLRFSSHDDGSDDLLLRDEIWRALAALPPTAPPALDVERLAAALHDSTWACPTGQVVPNWCDPRRGELFHVSQTQSIADEYARLASQPGEEGT